MVFFASVAVAASTGTIDPNNVGDYKAAFLDNTVMSNTAINFGKFTTESQYNITVSDTGLDGYAWGSSVGWMVMNCDDTTSGCSSTNGNFKVANDGNGNLSGYAWGENTGWISFGPFTDPAISTVKIDSTTGNFEGTLGSAGYAWSQNYGWIVFDCTNASTCVNTNWQPSTNNGGGGATGTGGGGASGGSYPPSTTTPTVPTQPTNTNNPTTTTPPSTPSAPTSSTGGQPSQSTTTTPSQTTGPTTPPPDSTNPPVPTSLGTTTAPGIFSNGLQFPPALTESLDGIVVTASNGVGIVTEGVSGAAKEVAFTLNNDPTIKNIATAFSAIAAIISVIALIAPSALLVSFTFSDIVLMVVRAWYALLIALGLRKPRRPWGTVYNSVTKQPIDPAYVVLMDMQGNEVATSITDIDGRYGFLVPAGTYKIMVNKTNFTFPSTRLTGKHSDELYDDLYFGEPIVIAHEGDVIINNIPLDQLNFDWNEFAKNDQKRLTYYHRSDLIFTEIGDILFWFGAIVTIIAVLSDQSLYNIIVFIFYIVVLVFRHSNRHLRLKSSVLNASTEQPLPFSIVRVFSAGTGQEITKKVTNRIGNYYSLLPNGEYKVTIERKDGEDTYTKIPLAEPVKVTEGYLKKDFKV
jgi:hypothetical protein